MFVLNIFCLFGYLFSISLTLTCIKIKLNLFQLKPKSFHVYAWSLCAASVKNTDGRVCWRATELIQTATNVSVRWKKQKKESLRHSIADVVGFNNSLMSKKIIFRTEQSNSSASAYYAGVMSYRRYEWIKNLMHKVFNSDISLIYQSITILSIQILRYMD